MASAPIGEIPVLITGDWSDLQTSIDDAVSAAEAGAKDIADAFSSSTGTNDVATQIDTATTSLKSFDAAVGGSAEAFDALSSGSENAATGVQTLDDKLEELYAQGMTAAEALATLSGNAGSLEDAITTLEGSTGEAASSIENVGTASVASEGDVHGIGAALEETGHSAEHAHDSAELLIEALTEFTGVALSFEALKEAAIESTQAFGNEQAAALAMTSALGGNAEAADGLIEKAKEMANALGQSDAAMISATQKLVNYGIESDQITSTLTALATAAFQAGQPLESIAQRFINMAQAGTLSTRSLGSMGISVSDVAAAMGNADLTSAETTKAFKAMGTGADATQERLALLSDLLQTKFPEAAKLMGDSVNAAWTRVANASEEALVEVGKSLGGFVGIVDVVKGGILALETVFLALLTPIKVVTDAIVNLGLILYESLTGAAKTAAQILGGDMAGAAQTAATAFDNVKNAGYAFVNDIKSDWTTSSNQIVALWTAANKTVVESTDSAGAAAVKLAGNTKELDAANKALEAGQTALDNLIRSSAPPVLDLATAQKNLTSAEAASDATKINLKVAIENLTAAIALGTSGTTQQKAAVEALKNEEANAKAAKADLAQAQKNLTAAQKDATAVSKEQATTDSDYATMLNTLGKQSLQGYATDQEAVTAAAGKYHDAVILEMDIQAQLDALVAQGKTGSDDYKTAQLALAAAHQQVATDLKDLNATSTDYAATSKALLSAQKDITSSQQQLDSIYVSQSIPNVKNLKQELDNLRDAKTQVAADTKAQKQAESDLQDVLEDYTLGLASLPDITQAQNDLDAAKKQTTADNKDLKQTETDLQTAFGLTKQAMQDIQNPETTMTRNTQDANAAFSALGIQSAQSLQTLADKATTAFNTITTAGTSSPELVRQANIKMLQDVQAAYIAEGTNLSSTQQATLTNLLNQQTDFNNSMINQWHNLYTTVEGDVSQLSNTLVTDLFTGKNSFGADALKGLETIASAFVTTLIKPVTDAIGKFIAGALSNLIAGFASVGTTATQAGSQVSLAFFGQATSSGVSSAASGVTGALGAVTSSLTGIVSAIGSVVGAIAGIVGAVETAHSNTLLDRIEHETARMAIYLGDQRGNSILGLMWRLVGDIEFGVMEKGILTLSTIGLKATQDLTSAFAYYSKYALGNLGQINSNTGSMLQAIQKGVNVTGSGSGGLTNTALANINETLQYEVGLNPWWQAAIENMNNGIVACAGWLQGIAGILKAGINVAGSTTSASSAGLSALATYIGANFTSLETWLFNALGKTMALPALPGAIAIPASLGGATPSSSGGLTINMTNTVNGSVVGQNGLNQFANGIGNILVNRLRGAGMKY